MSDLPPLPSKSRAPYDEWNRPKQGARSQMPQVQSRQHRDLRGLFERVARVLTDQQDRRHDQMRFP